MSKTHKEIYDLLISYITKLGFKVYDEDNWDDYSYNSFKIKGFYKWIFGIGVDGYTLSSKYPEGTKGVHFFTQHEYNLDKFKPSRSEWTCEESINDLFGQFSMIDWHIKHILFTLKYHPIYSFLLDRHEGDLSFKEPFIIRFIMDLIKEIT